MAGLGLFSFFQFGPDNANCAPNSPSGYIDTTMPEIAQWVSGSDAPAVAPRASGAATMSADDNPSRGVAVAGSRLQCNSPAWTESPLIDAEFYDVGTGRRVGAGLAMTATDDLVGVTLACTVAATSAGGTTSSISSGTFTIAAPRDPRVGITVSRRGVVTVTGDGPLDGAALTVTGRRGRVVRRAGGPRANLAGLPPGTYQACVATPRVTTYAAGAACTTYSRPPYVRSPARRG